MNAPLPLDRLHEDRDGFFIHRSAHGLEVVEWQMGEALGQRAEIFFHLVLTGCSNAGQGPAVEGICECEDAMAARGASKTARELDQAFIRLGPAVAEKCLSGPGDFHEALGELGLRRGAVEIRAMNETRGLIRHRRSNLGVRVTERTHRDARAEIQILATFKIPHAASHSALDVEIETTVGGNDMARVGFGKFAHILKVKRAEPLWVPPGPRGDSREKFFTRGWNNFLSTDYSAFLEVDFQRRVQPQQRPLRNQPTRCRPSERNR